MAWVDTEALTQGGADFSDCDGYGFGNDYGDGYGTAYGSGSGSGSGIAYGDGWGFGNDYGDGSGCAEGVPISVVILGRTQLHKRRLSDG